MDRMDSHDDLDNLAIQTKITMKKSLMIGSIVSTVSSIWSKVKVAHFILSLQYNACQHPSQELGFQV
jgi:hypothetical protein